jgi:hypothetical protein
VKLGSCLFLRIKSGHPLEVVEAFPAVAIATAASVNPVVSENPMVTVMVATAAASASDNPMMDSENPPAASQNWMPAPTNGTASVATAAGVMAPRASATDSAASAIDQSLLGTTETTAYIQNILDSFERGETQAKSPTTTMTQYVGAEASGTAMTMEDERMMLALHAYLNVYL